MLTKAGGRNMLGFIDIHSHILPGVDDGSRNMDETLNMLSIAYAEGTEVNIAAEEQGLKIQVILGNELLYSMDLIRELDSGEALTINGTRYILVEFISSTSYREIAF